MRISPSHMFVALLTGASGAVADGPDLVPGRVDLGAWRAPAAARGPVLWIPMDRAEEGTDPDVREGTWIHEVPWTMFEEPDTEPFPFARDTLLELLRAGFGSVFDEVEGSLLSGEGNAISFRVPAGNVREISRAAEDWARALAPSITVVAALHDDAGAGELLAGGGARLWPGLWTRVYLLSHRVPAVVGWDIEIAQESTVMNPLAMVLPEGREFYARYHPGESVSLVELWAGSVWVDDSRLIDMSEVRNVPEASAAGRLVLPRCAAQRAYTAVVLPAQAGGRQEIRWVSDGRASRLSLEFSPASPPTREGTPRLETVRIGASQASLDFEGRPSRTDSFVEGIRLPGVDGTATIVSEEIAAIEASTPLLEQARRRIAWEEAALASVGVSVRLLRVPEPTFRASLAAGDLRPGGAVSQAAVAALAEAGAADGWSTSLPVLLGTSSAFRVGSSVSGLQDLNVQVAQSSGGTVPVTASRFAGFAGQVRVDAVAGGHRLRLASQHGWADPEAGRLEVVFRPPVTMALGKTVYQDEPDFRRRVSLPILGGGTADLSGSVDIPSGSPDEYLVAYCVRSGEVVLALASLR